MEHLVFHDPLKRFESVVAYQSADFSVSIYAEGIKKRRRRDRNLEIWKRFERPGLLHGRHATGRRHTCRKPEA